MGMKMNYIELVIFSTYELLMSIRTVSSDIGKRKNLKKKKPMDESKCTYLYIIYAVKAKRSGKRGRCDFLRVARVAGARRENYRGE